MQLSLPDFLEYPDPEIYRSDNWLALDFETTNIEKGNALNEDNRLVLSCWQTQHGEYFKRGGELDQRELVEACNRADFLIAHNAKFELQWLERCGYDIGSRPVYDTMVAEWVLAGNRQWGKLPSLNACLERRGMPLKDDLVGKLIKSGVCPSDIPRSILLHYCRGDVRRAYWLYMSQLREMEGTRLVPIVYTRCLATPVLADIETYGLHLDATRVEKEYEDYMGRYIEVDRQLEDITGGINVKSPIQVAQFVYGDEKEGGLGFEEKKDRRGKPIRNKPHKQFPDGVPKTGEEILLSLRTTTDRQRDFIALKKQQAQLSAALDKNLSMFVGAVRENNGVFYGSINQTTTSTHRLSSAGRSTYYKMFDKTKGCQFQNLPRIFKCLFSARHDEWDMVEVDYGQLEFATAGHTGNEPKIAAEVRAGYDVHTYTRDVINSLDKKQINRTDAKRHTFKPLYGGQSGSKGEKAYYKAFADKYDSLKFTQDSWCIEVDTNKVLETEWGMRYYWPNARFDHDGWLNVKTNVYNTPIQAFATADIVPIGMVYAWHATRHMQLMIVNTVHDSLIAEVPRDEHEEYQQIVAECLINRVYKYLSTVYNVQFKVDLSIGITIGDHWGELPEGQDEIVVKIETPYPFEEQES